MPWPFGRKREETATPAAGAEQLEGLPGDTPAPNDELALIARLRAGDEAAFTELVNKYSPALLRLAMTFVPNREVAEDVVQETWMGVIRGIDRFEGRSSLKTWIYRILTNRAQTRGKREARSVAFSSLSTGDDEDSGPDLDRLFTENGHWGTQVSDWNALPEDQLLSGETLAVVRAAIERLPENQRRVITMRDVDLWTSDEVCSALAITETNQRVLLHRARTKVRRAVEQYLEGGH